MKMKKLGASLLAGAAMVAGTAPAQAGTDAYIGEVYLVGFNFCPRYTAEANGALLSISSNTALFSLLGTMYGGDGRTTFALPDLRGRVPIGQGTGSGLSSYTQGQSGGVETTTMTVGQMPQHSHVASVQTAGPVEANNRRADGAAFGVTADNTFVRPGTPVSNYDMAAGTVVNANTGGSQAQTNIQPYLAMRYCIVTQGIFPSRN